MASSPSPGRLRRPLVGHIVATPRLAAICRVTVRRTLNPAQSSAEADLRVPGRAIARRLGGFWCRKAELGNGLPVNP